jgi:UPF0271 protein
MKLDLNCDLGEGEPLSRTRALMRCITSANVACGGHAGNLETMAACARLAQQFGVRLGAHPGPWGRGDMGRGPVALSADEFELLLLQQVGALERVARRHGAPLHHIKLHGALYHASETSPELARRYLRTTERWWPRAILYVRAGGRVARLGHQRGARIWEEAFADRAYANDGTLVPRGEAGALFTDARGVADRVRRLIERGELEAISGDHLRLRAQTICVHADTPHAAQLARAVARVLWRGRYTGQPG